MDSASTTIIVILVLVVGAIFAYALFLDKGGTVTIEPPPVTAPVTVPVAPPVVAPTPPEIPTPSVIAGGS